MSDEGDSVLAAFEEINMNDDSYNKAMAEMGITQGDQNAVGNAKIRSDAEWIKIVRGYTLIKMIGSQDEEEETRLKNIGYQVLSKKEFLNEYGEELKSTQAIEYGDSIAGLQQLGKSCEDKSHEYILGAMSPILSPISPRLSTQLETCQQKLLRLEQSIVANDSIFTEIREMNKAMQLLSNQTTAMSSAVSAMSEAEATMKGTNALNKDAHESIMKEIIQIQQTIDPPILLLSDAITIIYKRMLNDNRYSLIPIPGIVKKFEELLSSIILSFPFVLMGDLGSDVAGRAGKTLREAKNMMVTSEIQNKIRSELNINTQK